MEGAAFAEFRLDPDAPAVTLDHLLADGEPDARSRVFDLVVQPLEHHEDALEVLRLDADAIVLHHEFPVIGFRHTKNIDSGNGCRAELERVADQILQELRELQVVALELRQTLPGDRRARLLDRGAQVGYRAAYHLLPIDRRGIPYAPHAT